MVYSFAALSLGHGKPANRTNRAAFASGPAFGVGVTHSRFTDRLAGNLTLPDAAHDPTGTIIEAALTAELPEDGATLVATRPGLPEAGAMAVLAYRSGIRKGASRGEPLPAGLLERVKLIAAAERAARVWQPTPLPTRSNPWPAGATRAGLSRALAPIDTAAVDLRHPLGERVRWVLAWLLNGADPQGYREQIERERLDLVAELETGSTVARTAEGGRMAVVASASRVALQVVGYSLAPVVVICNPQFREGGGDPHLQYTISQVGSHYADLQNAVAELAILEPGWGGSEYIGGSPRGTSSTLTLREVTAVVALYLR